MSGGLKSSGENEEQVRDSAAGRLVVALGRRAIVLAGLTIPEIFARYGEPYFRDGERRVMARLLAGGPQVIATGGGAFMSEETRAKIRASGVSIWLKADLDVLSRRGPKRTHRPLLQNGDPEAMLKKLMEERDPVYAQADMAVVSREGPHDCVVDDILANLEAHLFPPLLTAATGADMQAQEPA